MRSSPADEISKISGSGRAATVGLSAAYVSSSRCVRTSSNTREVDRVPAERVARLAADVTWYSRRQPSTSPSGCRDSASARARRGASGPSAAGDRREVGEDGVVRDASLRPVVRDAVEERPGGPDERRQCPPDQRPDERRLP